MTRALILVDIQNDYFTGGLWPVDEMDHDLGYGVTLVANACGANAMTFAYTLLTAKQVQAAFMAPLTMPYATVI